MKRGISSELKIISENSYFPVDTIYPYHYLHLMLPLEGGLDSIFVLYIENPVRAVAFMVIPCSTHCCMFIFADICP